MPTIGISWPQRSRGIGAPSSALSVSILLHDSSGLQADNSSFVLRSSDSSAHLETYALPQESHLGYYTLSLTFRSGMTESSQAVGTISALVRLTPTGLTRYDGTSLSSIVFDALIESVTVSPNQAVGVGGTTQLTATGWDHFSNPVVVSPGSFKFTLKSGSSRLTLTEDGIATGIDVGTAVVYATVDNIRSPDAQVTVLQEMRTIVNVASNDLAYDPISGLIWSTVGSTGSYANSLVGISPENGLVARFIALDKTPGILAISYDGQFAYVNIPSDGTTRQISLYTDSQTLSIPTGAAKSICTVPGSPHTVLVGGDPVGGVNVSVWDDSVRRANTGAGGYYIQMASPTVMYGNGDASLFKCVLVPGAINWVSQTMNLITNEFVIHNGLLIDCDGHVVNPNSMTNVGQLSTQHFLPNGKHIASSDSDNRIYIVTWDAVINKQILCYDLTTYEELPQRDTGFIPGGAIDIVACGNHTVAFRDYGATTSPNQIFIIRGLP